MCVCVCVYIYHVYVCVCVCVCMCVYIPRPESAQSSSCSVAEEADGWISNGVPHSTREHNHQNIGRVQLEGERVMLHSFV